MPETLAPTPLHARPHSAHGLLQRVTRALACSAAVLVLVACASTKVGPGEYRVKSGDTLSSIARAHNQSVSTLVRLNGLQNADRIEVDQILKVGSASAGAASPSPSASASATSSSTRSPSRAPARAPATRSEPTAGSIALAWPAEGQVVGTFNGASSKGIDIANSPGTPISAAAAGTVAYTGDALRGYGNLVILRHSGNFMTIYAHNRRILVKEGQTVKQGQRISEMGTQPNGRSALYFEVRAGSQPTNPTRFLPSR